jgi:hypothetical protein
MAKPLHTSTLRMAFDETLHDAFDQLSGRLGAELRLAGEQLTSALRLERERDAAEVQLEREHDAPRLEVQNTSILSTDESSDRAAIDQRLAAAIHEIGAARSLGDTLDTLASCAGAEAKRAAVLLVRGGRFRGWRFIGFEESVGAPETIDLEGEDEQAGVLGRALHADSSVTGRAPAFASDAAHEGVALPIAIGGTVVAVLYADEGAEADEGPKASRAASTARLDVLASYAARSLEAQTAFKAARELAARAEPPAVRREGWEREAPADFGAPADDAAAAARRYAHLLVSEIALYHEPAVIAGRRDRDLAQRLGDEIARARLLYEERVPAHVTDRADYFDRELLRTLAAGDPSLLAFETSSS